MRKTILIGLILSILILGGCGSKEGRVYFSAETPFLIGTAQDCEKLCPELCNNKGYDGWAGTIDYRGGKYCRCSCYKRVFLE